jgi:hypothetical protein
MLHGHRDLGRGHGRELRVRILVLHENPLFHHEGQHLHGHHEMVLLFHDWHLWLLEILHDRAQTLLVLGYYFPELKCRRKEVITERDYENRVICAVVLSCNSCGLAQMVVALK